MVCAEFVYEWNTKANTAWQRSRLELLNLSCNKIASVLGLEGLTGMVSLNLGLLLLVWVYFDATSYALYHTR